MGLTKLAITRPVTMFILMVLAILMGWTSYNSMRKELNPEVTFGVITVSTVYPGAGPDEIATLVSRRIEEGLSGIPGLREVTSVSQEGLSVVTGQFDIGTNMDEALNDARAKIDQVTGRLPQQAEKPIIGKFDTAADPVLRLVLRSDTLGARDLRDLADDKIKDRFARIPGVASVNVGGGDIREIQIQIKKDALLAYKLGVTDILRGVQTATLNVPSGRVITGSQEYSVRVLGEFKSVDEIENMRISVQDRNEQNSKPIGVRLGDVATIKDSVEERRSYARLNGTDAVSISIQKARVGNATEISHAAEKVIAAIEKDYGVKVVKTLEQAEQIQESLFDLQFALGFGILLVTAIVFIFLHNIRGTIIVGLAIPICLLSTFVVLKALGFTVNNMSMLALSLAIGVLVDDAIVVLENIFRHLKKGEAPVDAAINGRAEIGLAAIAITLADVVVFIPIANMGGIVGQFFKPLGIGFAVATLVSLFVSFTITPMLASRWFKPGEDVEHFTKGFPLWFENRFAAFAGGYRRMLEWSLAHRWFVFCMGWTLLVGIFMMIAGSFQPDMAGTMQFAGTVLVVPFVIAFLVIGWIAIGKALKWKWMAGLIGGTLVLGILVNFAGSPALLRMAAGLAVALGVIGFPINLFTRVAKSRMLLGGLGFGSILATFVVGGFLFAQWKGEPIFKFSFFPPSDGGQVQMDVTMRPGSTLAQTQEVVEDLEKIAMAHPDVKYVVSDIGSKGGGGGFGGVGDSGSNYASLTATLHDKISLIDRVSFWKKHEERLRSASDTSVSSDILQKVGRRAGADIVVSAGSAFGFGAPIQLSFRSDDRELLQKTAREILNRFESGAIKGVVSPELSSKPGKPEIRAIPDRIKLADVGVSSADVANTMRVLYEGDDTTKYRVSGKEFDIRVMMDLGDRNDPSTVENVPITFVQGEPIYLGAVAKTMPGQAVDKVNRRDREEEIQVTANLLPGFVQGTVQTQIDAYLLAEKLVPEGVVVKPLGEADIQAQESQYLFTALGLGFLLVYMLLASLYENLLYPLIIQLSQPQAMVGAILALVLTDKTLNIVGFIGIICLVGLVGKNAILLVDYTNTLRGRGKPRHDALVEAGPTRLRPIMMTTLALILGMLPVALAIGRGSEFRETIGITIIGGITLSTMLTLLVIPCTYTIFDDLSRNIARALNRKPHFEDESLDRE